MGHSPERLPTSAPVKRAEEVRPLRSRPVGIVGDNALRCADIYTDIRQFYPSIRIDLASRAWRSAAERSGLPSRYTALGLKFLEDARRYQRDVDGHVGLLTGPMISHLIGNLVLREIDEDMARHIPNGYFRYVDDVAIVAPPHIALAAEQRLGENLKKLGFNLNDDKRLETAADKWLESANDFDDAPGISWKTFIGDMKRLLLLYPDAIFPLRETFQKAGLRIQPLNYGEVVQGRDYLERLRDLMKLRWFRRSVRQRVGINSVLVQCIFLRNDLLRELRSLLAGFERLRNYERKRKLYRLKFLIARMLYLGSKEELQEISAAISGVTEMAMAAAAYDAVISRDVSQLLRYGPSAAQAAAQALRADGDVVFCKNVDWTKTRVVQACGVFQLNGLVVESDIPIPNAAVLRFSRWSEDSIDLFRSADSYFRELGCIHGMDDPDANRWAIETAFDRDDDIVFDIQETMQAYPY